MSSPTHQQSEAGSASSTGREPQRLRKLWAGPERPALLWRSLVGGILALFLSNIVFTVGLTAIRWPMPLKLVGIVCLLLTAVGIFFGVRALINVVMQLGLKQLFILLTVLYFIAVLLVGAVGKTDEQGARHWLASAGSVATWVIEGAANLGRAVLQAPDTVSFAATGRREPIRVSGGVEWVGGVPPTPIVVPAPSAGDTDAQIEEPTTVTQSSGHALQIGDSVGVVGTEGAVLRARATPSTDAGVVVRFPPNSILRILDGPVTVDGHVWWKVQGEKGEGWCAAEYLALDESP